VKAYSSILQAVPGVLFTVVAGPLSDRYGRRPLLIISLVGYAILPIIFLINSIWMEELAVEYLLLECLQVIYISKVTTAFELKLNLLWGFHLTSSPCFIRGVLEWF